MFFYLTIVFYVLYRFYELMIAKKNERKLNYPKEVGVTQRKLMFFLHAAWFINIGLEYFFQNKHVVILPTFIAPILLTCILIRYLSMKQLGVYWNTKIFKITNQPIVKSGLYKRFKNPNYLVVFFEILFIPTLFGLYNTALIFSIINLVFLISRAKFEQRVLYEQV